MEAIPPKRKGTSSRKRKANRKARGYMPAYLRAVTLQAITEETPQAQTEAAAEDTVISGENAYEVGDQGPGTSAA